MISLAKRHRKKKIRDKTKSRQSLTSSSDGESSPEIPASLEAPPIPEVPPVPETSLLPETPSIPEAPPPSLASFVSFSNDDQDHHLNATTPALPTTPSTPQIPPTIKLDFESLKLAQVPIPVNKGQMIGRPDLLWDRFLVVKKLQKGTYGSVHLVHDQELDRLLALKKVEKTDHHLAPSKFQPYPRYNNEAVIHQPLKHPHIVELKEFHENATFQYFVMEYVAGEELFNKIKFSPNGLSEKQISFYLQQLVSALIYLKRQGIIHRDLKSENILITSGGLLKLCDFGLATQQQFSCEVCGTPEYLAPEILKGYSYDYRVDIWSLGVLTYEMCYGRPPYQTNLINDKIDLYHQILEEPIIYPCSQKSTTNLLSHEIIQLMSGLLRKDPQQRLTYEQIQKHPFLSKFSS